MLTERQQEEYAYFNEMLPEWLGDELKRYKFAVIQGKQIRGLYDTFPAALEFGCRKFSMGEFIIQQIIDPDEIVEYLSTAVG